MLSAACTGGGDRGRTSGGAPAAGAAAPDAAATFRGVELVPPEAAPDFALTDQHGRPFRLSEQRGQPVLLFFGYTYCPDACPLTLAHFKEAREALGSDAGRVVFAFVTVDPERDTPRRLAEYLTVVPGVLGLTGDRDALAAVWSDFRVHVEVVPGTEPSAYSVAHSTRTYLVDGAGSLRLLYSLFTSGEDMAHDLRRLLEEAD